MRFAGRRVFYIVTVLCSTVLLLSSCSQKEGSKASKSSDEVRIRADVSLKPTLLEMAQNYHYVTNVWINFRFAPSASVLSDPAPDSVDVYIFGNDHYVEIARSMGQVDSTGEIVLAYAVPGVILPRFNRTIMVTDLSDLNNPQLRVGIADPQSDVLGEFTVEMLKKNDLYESLSHRLILTGPSALDLADRVSKSQLDAAIAWTLAANWYPESFDIVLLLPNEVPRVAVITAVRAAAPTDSSAADRLMTYLNSDRCANIFRKWGYLISESDVHTYAPAATIGGKPEF